MLSKEGLKKINKAQFPFWIIFLLVAFCLVQLSGCREDEPVGLVDVEFSNTENTVVEGNEVLVSISLSKKPTKDGSISLVVAGAATYGEDYFTTPARDLGFITLPIHKGESIVNFTVSTLANTIYEGDKVAIFTLSTITSGFKIGTKKELALTITDDEEVAIAEFAVATNTVAENSSVGVVVDVPFSVPTKGPGTVTVSIASNNAVYGVNFTTLPVANNNTIVFDIGDNATGTSFTVVPIDNSYFHADFSVAFELTSGNGSVRIGPNKSFLLTIMEDESPALADFNETGSSIPENDNSSGVVIQIPLSIPASETGSVTVSIASLTAIYGTHFTTIPAASGGNIFIDVPKGATQTEFTVLPIDDLVDNENRVINFTLTNATGAVRLGSALSYTLTVLDNEPTLRTILISFGRATAPLVGGPDIWNHAYDDSPSAGDSWSNLVRSDGVSTGVGILMNSSLTPQPLGKITGINSGTFPDNALKEYWYVPGPNQGITRGFSITQLSNSVLYSFKLIGGTTQVSSDGRNTMTVSVGGEQKSIMDVTNNVSVPLIWTDKSPTASIITINLTDTDGGGICPLNAMEISWYEDD